MKFTRTYYSLKGDDWKTRTEDFEQPVVNRIVYLAFLGFYNLEWRVKPIHKITLAADRLLQKKHDKTCNNDCGTWYKSGMSDPHPGCVRIPLDVQYDLKLYNLEHRNNTRP